MTETQVFQLAPMVAKSWWPGIIMAILVVVTVGALVLVPYMISTARNASFEVAPGALRIKAGFYGRTIPLADLDLEQARVVDLTRETDLNLAWRRNGVALPGLGAGWFSLNNGRKALVFVTNRTAVAYIPTRLDYDLLAGAADAEGLIAALRGAQGN